MLTGTGNSGERDQTNPATVDDAALVEGLRRRDEMAFAMLVERYHMQLVRLAMMYVPSRAVAEEVVQDTWIAVVQGIDRFEGRSSLKTWLFRILVNQAKRRGERESRIIPFAALTPADDDSGAEVSPDRFIPAGHHWAGHWAVLPHDWHDTPEERLLSDETRAMVQQAIDALPTNQRLVITMRDVDGLAPEEIRNVLSISETNQRVLLHRARAKVRARLEQYLEGA